MTKIKENKGFNKDIMFLLIFAVLVLLFLFNPLMTGKSYILDDIESQHYIIRNYMYEMGKAGKLFFWYPYMYSGQPFVADANSAVFYPPNWIYFFIPPERAMVYHVLIHFLIAGIFTFLLLRKYRMKPPAALAGAIIYTFSSFMILRIIHLNIMTGCALIPMVLFGAAYFLEKKNFTSALVLGFCMGVHLLAGMFQMSQIMFIITGIYIIGHLDFKNFINIENLKIFGLFILAVVFSFMVSSVQLLTSYEFISHSVRIGGIPLEMAMMGALGLKEMVLFLIPDYFGTASSPGGYRGGTLFWEVCFYVGFFPLMLAITAPFIADKEEKRNIIVFGIIAFIGLAISLGKNGLLYSIFYHIVPFFKSQRIPARYLVVLLMPITFYAALTIDKLTGVTSEISKKDRGKCKILLSIFSFIFAALTLFVLMASPPEKTGMILFIITGTAGLALFFLSYLKKMNSTIFQYASILIIFISALVFNYGIVKAPTDDTSYFKNRSKHFAAIENRKPPMRVYYFPEQNLKMTLNHPGTRGVSNIVGYNPLILDRYAEYMLAAEGNIRLSSDMRGELIKHANMFEIKRFNEEMTRLLNIELAYSFDYQPESIRMRKSELKNSYPRAFLVDDHIVIPQRQKVLQALKSPHADPSRILLLEQDPGFALMDGGQSEEELKIAEFVEFEPDYIKLKVNPDRQSWLFLSEIYFPGWKARVDGEERKVFRAHSIFRSVPLKPGEKIVELYYEPTYFKMGAILSIFAIIILISASVVNAVKMRKNKSDASIQAVPQLRKSS